MKIAYNLLILVLFLGMAVLFLPGCKKKHKKADEKIDLLSDTLTQKTNPDGTPVTSNQPGGATGAINPAYPQQMIEISGYIRGAGNANIILDELEIGGINPLESVIINPDGSFKVSTMINEPGIYQLRLPNGSIHLFLRGGRVKITGDISNLSKYEVDGSPESVHLREMYYLLDKFNHRTFAIQDRMKELENDKTRTKELLRLYDSLDIYYDKIMRDKSAELKRFIQKIDTSMVAILSGFYLDPDYNHAFLVKLLDKFKTICPHSKYYKQLADKVNSVTPISPGDPAPIIALKNMEGKEVSLNSLRGKKVLLYFWASDDDECLAANKKLKAIYDRYKNTGFEIYAVSLDKNKEDWKKAVEKDQINCIHVSNLAGREDDLLNVYKIGSMPYMYLIDRKGVIFKRGIKMNQLETEIRKIP